MNVIRVREKDMTAEMDGMISAVKDGLPTYVMPDNAIRCIGAMVKRAEYLRIRG